MATTFASTHPSTEHPIISRLIAGLLPLLAPLSTLAEEPAAPAGTESKEEIAHHTVIIDPGHGGSGYVGKRADLSISSANNSRTPDGTLERDLTLELSKEIGRQVRLLAPNYPHLKVDAILTRISDRNIDFRGRANLAALPEPDPSAIVSIHFNGFNGRVKGTSALIHNAKANKNYETDVQFARGLVAATSEAIAPFIPDTRARLLLNDGHLNGGKGAGFFYHLDTHPELAQTPKCFLEVEFIDNPDVANRLIKPRAQTFPIVARAIAEYLYAWIDRQENSGGDALSLVGPS